MLRLSGFIFGAAVAILLLAVIVVAPVRETAVALVTEIIGIISDPVDPPQTEQIDNISKVTVVSAVTQDKEDLPEPALIMKVDEVTPSAGPENAPSSEESTIAAQVMAIAPSVIQEQESEVLPTQSAPGAEKVVNTAPSAHQEVVSADSLTTADGNETDRELIAWQPVWRAFRSELSAEGFAAYLQRQTGQEYRVRRISPWTYQVELAYVDESQRDTLLHEIQTKIGMSLIETQP